MSSVNGCTACSAGAWVNASAVVNLLTPKEPGLMETIRDGQATTHGYAVPPFSTIEGMFAVINSFHFEQNEADVRPDEEMIRDDLFTQTYLQYPNATLSRFVFTIVNRGDSMDEKATKIIRWVIDHIDYATDEAIWGRKEMWQPPAVTFQRRTGDCEDGAFLVHSLLLNAGIPWKRVRTYGGLVRAGQGAETGGHAWTAYRRESDNEWVILDTSYFPNAKSVEERTPMRLLGDFYLDTLFYMTARYSVQTQGNHRIINPGTYTASGTWADRVFFPTGVMFRHSV
jgi:predicted transglutaminase-like cysteine proteinase